MAYNVLGVPSYSCISTVSSHSYTNTIADPPPSNIPIVYVDGIEEAKRWKKPYGVKVMTLFDIGMNSFYLVQWDDYGKMTECKQFDFYEHNENNNENNDESEENEMLNTNIFNGIFGKIAPGMCRLSMSGKIAIKTTNGYKAYDVESGRLTNCDSFAFDIGEDFFFVIPTNKVERGDIILVSGKPRCVLAVEKNLIKTMNYEDGSIQDIVPERHMFMGKQFFYGKIITMFGEMGAGSGDKGMKQMMKFMMLKEMMGGAKTEGGLGSVLPMMAMMGGMGGNFFDGMFDFGDEENTEDEVEPEDISR